ncbi:hypothetical protein GGQ85_000238 [Nitrobacter vulgaris]|uniref:hypothetical protein n=1 Tax=Nitrobacter vulgaris TaxID=29421 RepID=UPI002859D07B|nr:hypothetical protein [Nitrobacter vulgaris]MDR6302562.1 hypothetical protein [Nitrobacter vulgaris]
MPLKIILVIATFFIPTILLADEYIQQLTDHECASRGGEITQWMSSAGVVPKRGTCRIPTGGAPSSSTDRSPPSSSNGDVVKGSITERAGDKQFAARDWIGASITYELAHKYYGSGVDAKRVKRKMQIADCKEAQQEAKKHETDGDIRGARAALSVGMEDSCGPSETDVLLVETMLEHLNRLRSTSAPSGSSPTFKQSNQIGSEPTRTPTPVTPSTVQPSSNRDAILRSTAWCSSTAPGIGSAKSCISIKDAGYHQFEVVTSPSCPGSYVAAISVMEIDKRTCARVTQTTSAKAPGTVSNYKGAPVILDAIKFDGNSELRKCYVLRHSGGPCEIQ